jgi:hypothetical protein
MKYAQLLYMSQLKGKDESTLPLILASARRYNAVNGITGMLLYFNGIFLQVLEGPQAEVRSTFDRILQDPRHFGVFKMDEIGVDQRCFSDWSMGFQSLASADLDHNPDLASLFRASTTEIARRATTGTAQKVLQLFNSGAFALG